MIIANPIYDSVFKYLMQDNQIAKYFISTLLDEEIIDLELRPQEYINNGELGDLRVFRLDFSAKIKIENGEYKNVLIEIQKAKNSFDLMRFRNYLAEYYRKAEEIPGEIEKTPVPIITIYLLGFNLANVKNAVVKVKREYVDLESGKTIIEKDEFIEKLSHDCYVIQINQLKSNVQNRLSKLLSIFEQNYFIDSTKHLKEYPYPIEDEAIGKIIKTLEKISGDSETYKTINEEDEMERIIDVYFGKFKKQIAAKDKELASKEQELENKEKELERQRALIEELLKKVEKNK